MLIILASVVAGCSTTPKIVEVKPKCSPVEPPAKMPFVSDGELSKMSPKAKADIYEVVDRLLIWGDTNYKILAIVCNNKKKPE